MNNAVNAVGRILTGWVGDRVGRQNTLCSMCLFCVAAVGGLWLGSIGDGGKKGLWLAFVVIYGMAGGGYNALFPTVSLPPRLHSFLFLCRVRKTKADVDNRLSLKSSASKLTPASMDSSILFAVWVRCSVLLLAVRSLERVNWVIIGRW